MLPDLKRLIRLQHLDNDAVKARRTIEEIPARMTTLGTRLDAARTKVEEATRRLDDQKEERQAVEKKLAEVQSRLSRFKEQLMTVKTNKEYTAMQHEIATAEAEVAKFEDRILEHMLTADLLAGAIDEATATEDSERTEVEDGRRGLEGQRAELEQKLAGTSTERAKIAENISVEALRLYESIARQRQGLALVKAKDGLCTVCNVRLRPQIFNQVLLNTELLRCGSCMRILYHDPDDVFATTSEDGSASRA